MVHQEKSRAQGVLGVSIGHRAVTSGWSWKVGGEPYGHLGRVSQAEVPMAVGGCEGGSLGAQAPGI